MRARYLVLVCLLSLACSPGEHTPGQGEDGSVSRDGGELTTPRACRELYEQVACEAQGCRWIDCPPNADCQYVCEEASVPPDGKAACEQQGGVWTECAPTEDCIHKCVMPPSEPADASLELPTCLDDDGKLECTACRTQAECEGRGCHWRECPPNADCAYTCFDEQAQPAQPDGGEPSLPVDRCSTYADGTTCAQAGCDWRMCPPDQGGYHCVDATRCQSWERESCEAEPGCLWKECPPNADCAYQCHDARIDEC